MIVPLGLAPGDRCFFKSVFNACNLFSSINRPSRHSCITLSSHFFLHLHF